MHDIEQIDWRKLSLERLEFDIAVECFDEAAMVTHNARLAMGLPDADPHTVIAYQEARQSFRLARHGLLAAAALLPYKTEEI